MNNLDNLQTERILKQYNRSFEGELGLKGYNYNEFKNLFNDEDRQVLIELYKVLNNKVEINKEKLNDYVNLEINLFNKIKSVQKVVCNKRDAELYKIGESKSVNFDLLIKRNFVNKKYNSTIAKFEEQLKESKHNIMVISKGIKLIDSFEAKLKQKLSNEFTSNKENSNSYFKI